MSEIQYQCGQCGDSFPEHDGLCRECAGLLRDDLAEAGAEEEEENDE